MDKKEKILKLDINDIELLNYILWEIEEFVAFENSIEEKSLDKLKDFFNYDSIQDIKEGEIKIKYVHENINEDENELDK